MSKINDDDDDDETKSAKQGWRWKRISDGIWDLPLPPSLPL